MNEHELKILPEFFDDVVKGIKTFEVRKNDRDYRVADILHLREYDGSKYTGRRLSVVVTYILNDSRFCKEGYVIMGIKF